MNKKIPKSARDCPGNKKQQSEKEQTFNNLIINHLI